MKLTNSDLRALRRAYHLTLEDTAQLLGFSKAYLSMVENEAKPMTDALNSKIVYRFELTRKKMDRIYEMMTEFSMEARGS